MNKKQHHTKEVEVLEEELVNFQHDLLVFNDDVNTFEHVIATLIHVCGHTPEQAEQCTWLIHYTGKCTVKTGDRQDLTPICKQICSAGIDARIV